MSQEQYEKLVSIDWKFAGRDYMGFFPEHYPELEFLFSQEWEDLCDRVANEMPENLFDEFSLMHLLSFGPVMRLMMQEPFFTTPNAWGWKLLAQLKLIKNQALTSLKKRKH